MIENDMSTDFDIRPAGQQTSEGVCLESFTYLSAFGERRAAYFIRPEGDGPYAAILYVHWYEPEALDSNRTQFVEEAKEMARRGAASLLVETMWSDRDWFIKRTQAQDYVRSVRQTAELRQAADLLLSQPWADGSRFAFVGHDFGAMYGAVMGAIDERASCYVLMAGTPRFPDWFLYYPTLEGEAREKFMEEMAPLDPIHHVGELSPSAVLFQFAKEDPHVPVERAEAFFAAAGEPKELRWYEGGHGLNEEARGERMEWVSEQLGLSKN
jgi:dienelactone hydrolase